MTGTAIFRQTLAMMGETPDETLANVADLKERALHYLNLLLTDVQELDSLVRGEQCSPSDSARQLSSLSQEVEVCDQVAHAILPLGLAFFLLLEEDAERSNWYFRLFSQAKKDLRGRVAGRRHRIRDMFGCS